MRPGPTPRPRAEREVGEPARLAAGADTATAAAAGVVAGSLAATRAGAQPSMPTGEEIDRLVAALGTA